MKKMTITKMMIACMLLIPLVGVALAQQTGWESITSVSNNSSGDISDQLDTNVQYTITVIGHGPLGPGPRSAESTAIMRVPADMPQAAITKLQESGVNVKREGEDIAFGWSHATWSLLDEGGSVIPGTSTNASTYDIFKKRGGQVGGCSQAGRPTLQ